MPRTGKGGARQGNPGANYTNRTDLQANRKLAVSTVPGQQYGAAGQQQAAQRAIPMASGPPAAEVQSATPPAAAPPQTPMPGPATAGMPMPGELTPLHAPTDRPQEPVTAGAPSGPGAGPEAIQMGLNMNSMSNLISQLAQASKSSDLAVLAQHAASLGQ